MDCKAVQQVIYRFIYNESDADELRRVKEHLDRCGHCRREREIIEELLNNIKSSLTDEPIPKGFRERMLARIHAAAEADD